MANRRLPGSACSASHTLAWARVSPNRGGVVAGAGVVGTSSFLGGEADEVMAAGASGVRR